MDTADSDDSSDDDERMMYHSIAFAIRYRRILC